MNRKNTDFLHNAYPKLYSKKVDFECDDGWFNIINDLSEKLETLIKQYENLNPDRENECHCIQVKEKCGKLRFYMTTETQDISDAIEKTESATFSPTGEYKP